LKRKENKKGKKFSIFYSRYSISYFVLLFISLSMGEHVSLQTSIFEDTVISKNRFPQPPVMLKTFTSVIDGFDFEREQLLQKLISAHVIGRPETSL